MLQTILGSCEAKYLLQGECGAVLSGVLYNIILMVISVFKTFEAVSLGA